MIWLLSRNVILPSGRGSYTLWMQHLGKVACGCSSKVSSLRRLGLSVLIVIFVMLRPPLQNCLGYMRANLVVGIWALSEGRQEETRNGGHSPSWEACVEWRRGRRPT
jgi:hypothetical protein